MAPRGSAVAVPVAVTLALLLATIVVAQESARLSGVVRDAAGAPIQGAEVTLTNSSATKRSVTDVEGRFSIDAVVPGRYELKVRGEMLRESAQVVDVPPGAGLDLTLDGQRIHTETVIVTASRGEESLVRAPAAVSVLTGDEISTSAALSVPALLHDVPGLNIVQFGSRDFEINSRSSSGILANSMLVMVDGRSFFQPLYGAVYWDLLTVSADGIAQIEVLRTPASAVWGANALNGVVNIRTKSPRQVTGLRGQIGMGNHGTKSADVSWADARNAFSYKLSASYFEQDPWPRDNRLPDGGPMPVAFTFANRGTRQPKVDARVDWDRDPHHVWSLRGGLSGAYGLTHSALGPGQFDSGSYASYLEADRHTDNLDVKVYWNRLDAPFNILLFGLPEHATNDTFVADVAQRVRVGTSHRLTFGGSIRSDRFDVSIAPADRGRVEGGAFVEDQATINSVLAVTVGGRVDKFDTTDAVFAPRLGAVMTVSPRHSFRVTYNRAYRAPSLLENFLDVTLPTVVPLDPPFFYTQRSIGSTSLAMEKQDAFEVGYTGVVAPRTTVFVTAYTQRISDNITFLPVSFYGPGAPPPGWPGDPALVPVLPQTFTFINLGRLRDRGIELASQVDLKPFAVRASYTFQDVPSFSGGPAGVTLPINRPPRHQGGVTATYRREAWTAEGSVHYTARAFWADVFSEPFWGYTSRYHSIDGRVSYQLPLRSWEAWVSATNLSNEAIKTHVYGDTIGRTMLAGLRWR